LANRIEAALCIGKNDAIQGLKPSISRARTWIDPSVPGGAPGSDVTSLLTLFSVHRDNGFTGARRRSGGVRDLPG
jgi:hypothetical protein